MEQARGWPKKQAMREKGLWPNAAWRGPAHRKRQHQDGGRGRNGAEPFKLTCKIVYFELYPARVKPSLRKKV